MKKAIIVIFIFLILLVLYIYKDKIIRFGEERILKEELPYGLEFKGVKVVGWHEGKKQWEISAEVIKTSKDQRLTYFYNIYNGHFFENNKKVLKFVGDYAVYDNETLNLEITGDVKLISDDVELVGEKLLWQGNLKKLNSVGKIIITTKNSKIFASQLICDVELENVELYDVKAEFKIEEEKVGIL